MNASLSAKTCGSMLRLIQKLRHGFTNLGPRLFVDIDSVYITVRGGKDGDDELKFNHRDYINNTLVQAESTIPAFTLLLCRLFNANSGSMTVVYRGRRITTFVGEEDDRVAYDAGEGIHVAIAIRDTVSPDLNAAILDDDSDVTIVFRCSVVPDSVAYVASIEPSERDVPPYANAGEKRVAITRLIGRIFAERDELRQLALERCSSFSDANRLWQLVFPEMGSTVFALLPSSNLIDVVPASNILVIPPVIRVRLNGSDIEGWTYAAGIGFAVSDDDIVVALDPRESERFRSVSGEPTFDLVSLMRDACDDIDIVVAESKHAPYVVFDNGVVRRLEYAPVGSIGACFLNDSKTCVLFGSSYVEMRKARQSDIVRAIALAMAKNPSDIGAALHEFGWNEEANRLSKAFCDLLDISQE